MEECLENISVSLSFMDWFLLPSKNYGLEIGSVKYDPVRFAFKPLGGSLVILTPFCRIAVGNFSEG
jgi:hypothetical protein